MSAIAAEFPDSGFEEEGEASRREQAAIKLQARGKGMIDRRSVQEKKTAGVLPGQGRRERRRETLDESDASSRCVDFELILDFQMSDIIGHMDEFKDELIRELASAVGGQRDRIHIRGLEAGSVIVHVIFDPDVCGKMQSALDALRRIEQQVGDPVSKLRQGRYACHAKGIRVREPTLRQIQTLEIKRSPTAFAPPLDEHTGAEVLCLDDDTKEDEGVVDSIRFGAFLVRIDGVVLYYGGDAQPYKAINGEYELTEQVCNGRGVYVKKSDKAKMAMWCANNDGKICWCVGPKDKVGGEGMWAYVEIMACGPEEAGTRAWTVYSYNSNSWEEQHGVEVVSINPPEKDDDTRSRGSWGSRATEDVDTVIREGENEDFDAAVEQAEATRASRDPKSTRAKSSLRTVNGKARPLTGSSVQFQSHAPIDTSHGRPRTQESGTRRLSTSSGGSRSRPLTPLEQMVEGALLSQIRSRPQTPQAPDSPAESDKKHHIVRGNTPPAGRRPSTAARLLEKQKAAAAAVAAEKLKFAADDARRKAMQDQEKARQAHEAAALKLQKLQRGHLKRSWFKLEKRMYRMPGQIRNIPFERKYPSCITWKLPRKRGLAIDMGLWDTPWRMVQGTDWRDPNSPSFDTTVLRHSIYGTVIELKHAQGSGKSFVFKATTTGDTPKNTPGNTPRHADKVKICREDAYVADWRFNAAFLLQRMEVGEGTKLPAGPISFGCWNFEQSDPAVVCDEVFRKLDTDGSGTMEPPEVYQASQIMGFTDMTEEDVAAWIKEHDEDGNGLIDAQEFQALLGIDPTRKNNMKITTKESSSELWLTAEGFIMLAYNEKNDAIVCVGGQCLPYAVPKNAAWQHLGRADEALKRTEFAAAEAAKKAAENERLRMLEMADVMARLKKENEKLAKLERRRVREAEAKNRALVPSS